MGFTQFLISFVLLIAATLADNSTIVPIEKVRAPEVLKVLTKGYDRGIRPPNYVNGSNNPVDVEVNVYVRSMSNIDFVKMEYSLQITFRQSWIDPRLAYGEPYEGKKVPRFIIINKSDVLWIPDTFFMNEKQAHRHLIDTPNMLFRVHPDGRVLYSERISLVLSCPMFLQRFPMDKQQCQLMLASYAYTDEDIVYSWKKDSPLQFHHMLGGSLPCFQIANAETGTCTSKTNTGVYPCLSTTFHLHRQFSYYMLQIYVPSTLLVIVSWVSFWLDRTAVPARVTLGVTTLLTITTQATSLNAQLPAVSYVKAVDVWMGGCLAFIFAAVFEYACVSHVASVLETKRKMTKCVNNHHLSTEVSPESEDTKKEWNAEEEHKLLKPRNSTVKNRYCGWWEKWTFEADESKMIDVWSRILFPVLFIVFQVCYWTWYSNL